METLSVPEPGLAAGRTYVSRNAAPAGYVLLRAYLQHRGRFAAQLIQSAGHVVQRDHAAARRAVVWALRISPIHAVLAIARLLIARSDDQMVLRLRAVPATHADDARVSAKEGD